MIMNISKKMLICQVVASKDMLNRVFEESFKTIYNLIGLNNNDFTYMIFLDKKVVDKKCYDFLLKIKEEHNNILLMKHLNSWAKDVNFATMFANENKYEWIALFHDDVIMETKNWAYKLINDLCFIKNLGLVTSTDTVYRKVSGALLSPGRDGHYIDTYQDMWTKGKSFQFHNMPEFWNRDILYKKWTNKLEKKLDYPKKPVKIFSTWSAVMIGKVSLFNDVGKFEDWCPFTLLNELDFNMRCIMKGYHNCWVPDFYTEHFRKRGERPATRSNSMISEWSKKVHADFLKKWGVGHSYDGTEDFIIQNENRFRDTPIDLYINKRYSYDYEYF